MPEIELGPLRFAIAGAGRVGVAMGRALQEAGLELVAASSRTEQSRSRAAQALGVPLFSDPHLLVGEADVILLAVPDSALPDVVFQLREALESAGDAAPRPRFVHTSGVHPVGVLAPLAALGCATLAMHPVQTFTLKTTPADLRGMAAAITAHDRAEVLLGHALAHAVGMVPFDLPDEHRALYHAACSMAANFSVTLLAAAEDCAVVAGMPPTVARHALASLARSAATRVEREGANAALTGPIVRGDADTLVAQARALAAERPSHFALFLANAVATSDLAIGSGRLDGDGARRIIEVLQSGVAAVDREAADAHD